MILALLLSQMIQPAGPSVAVAPATAWRCEYVGSDGAKFALSGVFPEFPAGSPANSPLPTSIVGTGPAFLLGDKPVNSYNPKNGKRIYQISFVDAQGDRYNLNFQLAKSGETPTDITEWNEREQRLRDYAKGKCIADFNPENAE